MLRSLNGFNYRLCCTVRHMFNHVTVHDLDSIQTSVEFLTCQLQKVLVENVTVYCLVKAWFQMCKYI